MTKDPAWALADHIIGTGFGDLPPSTRAATCADILDTFGCLLGGSGAPGIAELVRIMDGWGGASQSQVMLWRRRMPAPQAAMLNASMAHALDFDDTLDHGGSIHPGASVLAASLATAGLRGGVSGESLLLAVALGLDVSCRVALASTVDRGWHRTAAMGVFGAAAASGKLLGLTVEQMVNALGIAFSQLCRQPSVHRRWRTDQAPASRTGRQQWRLRGQSRGRGLYRCAEHLPRSIWILRAVSAQWPRSCEAS
jgi:2-methylcitrate dehydratase PrpD